MPADLRGGRPGDHKQWWPQCETMNTAFKLYRVLGDESFIRAFVNLLGFVEGSFINPSGEWYNTIDNGWYRSGLKADAWKGR